MGWLLRPNRSTLGPLIAIFAVAGLLRWPIADIPLERDEGEYGYIAQRWLLGEVPYRDSFDQKPPGVFVAYAVLLKLSGSSPASIHWGTQVYNFGTLGLIFLVSRRLFGTTEGLLASLFAAYMTNDLCVLGNAANTETFMILPLTAALLATLLAIERDALGWALAAGICSSLALQFKQVALPNVALCAAFLLTMGSGRWRLLAAFAGGGILGVAPTICYFAIVNALADIWDCVIGHNLAYSQRVPWIDYPWWFWQSFRGMLGQWWGILLLAAFGTWSARDAGRSALKSGPLNPSRIILLWLLASAAGVSIGGYFRPHYYVQAIPPLAILAGRGSMALGRRWSPDRPGEIARCLTSFAIIWGVLVAPWYYLYGDPHQKTGWIYGGCPFAESLPVADYLRNHSQFDETVFIFGSEPQILFYADRPSASRYIFVYPLMTPFPDTRERQRGVIDELTKRSPRFLVIAHQGGSFLDDEDTPTDLRDFVERLRTSAYVPVAWVAAGDADIRTWPKRPAAERHDIPPNATITIWDRICPSR